MAAGLFMPALEAIEPERLPISVPAGVPRERAMALASSAPSNQQVLDACKQAYTAHQPAVDAVTTSSVDTAQAPSAQHDIDALHTYDWNRKVAAPKLTTPILQAPTMAPARKAVDKDGAFATWFIGVEASADIIIGGTGGVGVGVGIPSGQPMWMAYGGLRISVNIDIAVNINTGVFLEAPSDVAGDYIGIEMSAEPIYEGPSLGLGIHLSTDLSEIRGFSLAVGVELGLLPFNVAVVYGTIATALGARPAYGMRPVDQPVVAPPPMVRQMGAMG
jgi:hypothetical protein